jgi:type II secretory pathway component PulJ
MLHVHHRNHTMKTRQQGITLIEMMIAMLLGLMVTGSIIAIFISNVKSSSENIKMIRLNQELRGTMTFISDELKRAGYSANPILTPNFMDEFNVNGSCLRYAYDDVTNASNTDGSIDNNERMAFNIAGKAIRWGTNVNNNDCSDGNWQDITDTNIAEIIVVLGDLPVNCLVADYPLSNITLSSIPAGTLNIQQFTVRLTAKTNLGGNEVCRSISETIRVRNEDAT